MMPSQKIVTAGLVAAIEKIRPDQVLVGEQYQKRRIPTRITIPDYASAYAPYAPTLKMCYCGAGTCRLVINGIAYRMKQGDLALIRRNVDEYEAYLKKDCSYSLLWFLLRGWQQVKMHQSVYGKGGSFNIINRQNIKVPNQIYRTIDDLVFSGSALPGDWPGFKQDLAVVFNSFHNQKPVFYKGVTNKWQKKILQEVQQFISDNYREDLDLKGIAQKFSFSPAYLDTLFREEFGLGIIHHLILRRMHYATHFLETTNKTVTEVAYELGYKNIYYFSRLFKKVFGISPREYREKFL
jgi:AraC-like DNA-binding protein